jgi:hypothetical protein
MKVRYCKFLGCPRLLWAATQKGAPDFAQCNQHMPDSPVYFENCAAVSKERCKELRRALKVRREVQG